MIGKKFAINLGFARSGTTTLHRHFTNNDMCCVPEEEKEIKAFMDDSITLDKYLSKFNHDGKRVIFESSPPYCHTGIQGYTKVLQNIKSILGEQDLILIFNIREPIERAFSHYWYNIGKHHSIFGKRWNVKSYDHERRFKDVFDSSFYDCLKIQKQREGLFPPYHLIIRYAVELLGVDRVKIIHVNELNQAVPEIFKELGVPYDGDPALKVNQYVQPSYYHSKNNNIFEVTTINNKYLIKIPSNKLLILSGVGAELLDGEQYDLWKIAGAANHWTRTLDSRLVQKRLIKYYKKLYEGFSKIEDSCFVGDSKALFLESLFTHKVHKSKTGSFNHKIEDIDGIEIMHKV
ncbi:hypothetical protein [Kangiella shandongensis]|uniref:hypothetical protein n=1 Tax=Kangiella shandongensis TaxID=2763258 RepID=UPI001CC04A78|nr:hypothetical protein [Kangiella shandongensis]